MLAPYCISKDRAYYAVKKLLDRHIIKCKK